MADIFISYAKKDREKVEPIANALTKQGYSVFWDRTIPGGKIWDEVIEEELDAARCVVVVWSKISIKSRWVRAEAEEGLHRNILVPVSIEDVKIPLLFRPIQSVRLIQWQGDSNNAQFKKLITDLSPILGSSPLKVKEAEQMRTEEAKHRREPELKQKAEVERLKKKAEAKRKAEEEQKKKEAEAKRKAEEEQKKKEIEEQRKIEEERKHKEEEQKRRADEGQRRKEEDERKLESEEKRKHRVIEANVKTEMTEPDAKSRIESGSSEHRKSGKALKFAAAGAVIVLLIVGIWWYVSSQQINKVRQEIDEINRQTLMLEDAVSNIDKLEQIEELYKQKNTLNSQVAAISEQTKKVGLESQLAELQKSLKQIQDQLANKEKELIAARKGKIFVASVPDNATVKFLNIDETFQQGMELEPGKYHLQVSLVGYEPKYRLIELDAGEEERIGFKLEKIIPKIARLFVETIPEDATVRILNIKPKFVQGMELEPGSYHMEVGAKGYETNRQWIDLAVVKRKYSD